MMLKHNFPDALVEHAELKKTATSHIQSKPIELTRNESNLFS